MEIQKLVCHQSFLLFLEMLSGYGWELAIKSQVFCGVADLRHKKLEILFSRRSLGFYSYPQ
jgi:hypothetical protein